MNQDKIGKFIKELRTEKGIKQHELADLLGVTSKTISRWETGVYMPDLSLFTSIIDIFGITLNELMQGERLIDKKNENSIEIEAKFEIDEDKYKELINYFTKVADKHIIKRQHDIYFSPRSPKFFGGKIDDECIRIRVQKDKYILGYKKIYLEKDESDIHLIEHETEVSDLNATINILKGLRIDKVCDLKKNRDCFIYQNLYEISLDAVEDLGYFIELEIHDKSLSIKKSNELLLGIIKEMNLDITKRNLKGYSYLMYERMNKTS